MDFDTLVDLEDYFDGGDAITDLFADDGGDFVIEEAPVPEPVETEPLPEVEEEKPEAKAEEPPQVKQIEELVQKSEAPSQDLLMRVEQAARENGESGIKSLFDNLSDKEKNSMLRYAMGAMGVGAREAIRAIQQRRSQEFQREQSQRGYEMSSAEAERERQFRREMTDKEYQESRAREERDREARRVAGTPSGYQFNVTPRGLIGGGMGG